MTVYNVYIFGSLLGEWAADTPEQAIQDAANECLAMDVDEAQADTSRMWATPKDTTSTPHP